MTGPGGGSGAGVCDGCAGRRRLTLVGESRICWSRWRAWLALPAPQWPKFSEARDPCDYCGIVHTQEQRLGLLRRLLAGGAPLVEIREAYTHIWGPPIWDDGTEGRRWYRDIRTLGIDVRAQRAAEAA